MTKILSKTILFLFCCGSFSAFAQKGVLTLGVQFKPIIPASFFVDEASVTEGDITATLAPKSGYSFGMVVRRGFSDLFAMELGINYIQRKYDSSYLRGDPGYAENGDITFVGYELPLMAMVFVRLGQKTYMNVSAGPSLDFFPSDVETVSQELHLYFYRKNWVQGSIIANLGFEFRTEKKGYFYAGATYHRPFTSMVVAEFTHYENNFPTSVRTELSGNYLTVDLRYYFYTDPDKKKQRKVDRSNRDGL